MTVKSDEVLVDKTTVIDDLADEDALAALKAKIAARTGNKVETKSEVKVEKKRSIKFGVIGSGQAGSRCGEIWYNLGYDTIVMNTAPQDLEHIKIPDSNKLLLQYGLGGAAKELEIGKEAAETHREAIQAMVEDKLGDCQAHVLCLSLGGGSGAGSCETLVDILSTTGKPLVMLVILPMESDDAMTKNNSLTTLAAVSKMCQNKQVQSIVVCDNSKIEAIYSDINQLRFFPLANAAIVEPIDAFNVLSAQPSPSKALDSTEWAKLLVDSEGFTVFGSLIVNDYDDDVALSSAVLNNLSNNLLAEGFDLTQAKYVGWIVAANEKTLSRIPQRAFTYANTLIQEKAGTPKAIFRGVYVVDDPADHVKVYSCFSGLGLPNSRIDALKKDAQALMGQSKVKDDARNLTLNLDVGNETVNAAQKVKEKIAAKSSAFGKFMGNVVDKRNK